MVLAKANAAELAGEVRLVARREWTSLTSRRPPTSLWEGPRPWVRRKRGGGGASRAWACVYCILSTGRTRTTLRELVDAQMACVGFADEHRHPRAHLGDRLVLRQELERDSRPAERVSNLGVLLAHVVSGHIRTDHVGARPAVLAAPATRRLAVLRHHRRHQVVGRGAPPRCRQVGASLPASDLRHHRVRGVGTHAIDGIGAAAGRRREAEERDRGE